MLGTPTAGRHGDGDRQAAARLAGQHHLASPPDLASRHRRPDTDQEDSEAGLYTETGSLADNELDSEISSVWGPGPGEPRLPGLALVSPLARPRRRPLPALAGGGRLRIRAVKHSHGT